MKRLNKQIMEQINTDIETYIEDIKTLSYRETDNHNEGKIHLDLKNVPIFNEYSGGTLLDEGIYHFIDETYKITKKRTLLSFDITFPENMTLKEQERIKNIIKAHYAIAYKTKKKEIARTKIIAWVLLGIGALLFLLYGLLEWYKVNFVFQGIIEIFSWVFIWESCNLFVFTNTENKIEMVKDLKLFNAIKNENSTL